MNISHLTCLICGDEYQPNEVAYVCPKHGNEGILDVRYDYAAVAKSLSREALKRNCDPTIWRYKALLPVASDAVVPPLTVGGTPLYAADRLAAQLGVKKLWIKDDGRQPSASFKDRASSIAVVKAREQKAEIIATASSGNAAAALSAICASVGQPNVIFVPESAPQAKVTQLLAFGSQVMLVEGSYDQAFDLSMQACEHYGWYNRNTGYNPYMTEGKKTVSLEICEQLEWQAPDVVVVAVGDGCIIGGVHKGLKDLLAMGWIEQIPRIFGIQSTQSPFFVEAFERDEDVLSKAPAIATTVADSISVGLPRDRIKGMAAVKETGGTYIAVTDQAILAAIPELASGTGVFAEPAGATAYAGLLEALERGLISADDRVVVINTGNGLKDIPSAIKAVAGAGREARKVRPNLAAVQMILKEQS